MGRHPIASVKKAGKKEITRVPKHEMLCTLTYSVKELVPFINWLYFFYAWQIPRQLTRCIVNQESQGGETDGKLLAQLSEGRRIYEDAMRFIGEFDKRYTVSCRIGLFEAQSEEDDIFIYNNGKTICLPCLRQQHVVSAGTPNLCLSDYIAPIDRGMKDRIGAFAATVTAEMEQTGADDPYLHLIAQTVCDRLAEAATEKAHLKVRKEIWGYAPDEQLTTEELFQEKFRGIRPAVGYPSLPDQSVNFILDELIDMASLGIAITENGAMSPHASVSGFMFAHPQAKYFSVGKIGEDQLEDYSQRRGLPLDRMKQYLSANI